MDPILIAAIRKLVQAQHNAQAAGMSIGREDADAFLRRETHGKYGAEDAQQYLSTINSDITARNLGRSAVQGAAFNFGDELLGKLPEEGGLKSAARTAAKTVLSHPETGIGGALFGALTGMMGGGGEAAKEDMRLREDLFREQHPKADLAAGFVGGLVPGLLVPGAGAATLPEAALKAGATGAAAGALAGAGAGEDAGDRATRAGIGGLFGGVLGAGIGAGGTVASRTLSREAAAGDRLATAVARSGGADAVRKRLGEFAAEGRPNEPMMLDLSDYLRQEGDFAANNADEVFVPLAQRIAQRQKGMSTRMLNDVEDLVGQKPDATARLADLKQQKLDFAKSAEGYAGLQAENAAVKIRIPADMVERVEQGFKNPMVQDAWKAAERLKLVGNAPKQLVPDFRQLQSFRSRVDAAVGGLYKQGLAGDAEVLKSFLKDMDALFRAHVPEWARVDATYRAMSDAERMVERGTELFHQNDSRELKRLVASLGDKPELLSNLRYGLASELVAMLRGGKTNRNFAETEIMNASPAMQDVLEAAFGDKKTFDAFMHRAELEATLGRAKGVLGNSATARRLQAAGVTPEELGVAAATGGGSSALLSALTLGLKGKLARGTARRLGPMLMTQGQTDIERLLQSLDAQGPAIGRTLTSTLPTGAASLFDHF